MRIGDRLESIRRDFPACETLAYADISTATVLSSSAATQMPQEQLDHLCSTAVEKFSGPSAAVLADFWQNTRSSGNDVFHVIVCNAAEFQIFIKSTTSPTDAFCCICTPLIEINAFILGARYHLDEIGQDI